SEGEQSLIRLDPVGEPVLRHVDYGGTARLWRAVHHDLAGDRIDHEVALGVLHIGVRRCETQRREVKWRGSPPRVGIGRNPRIGARPGLLLDRVETILLLPENENLLAFFESLTDGAFQGKSAGSG